MGFLDRLKQQTTEAASTVIEKGQEAAKVGQLQVQLRNLRSEEKEAYASFGREAYRLHQSGQLGTSSAELAAAASAIADVDGVRQVSAIRFAGARTMGDRVDVVGIDRETPWSEVVDRVRSSEHSRLPVYDETLDEIVGILYAKDMLPAVIADVPPPGGWQTLVRPAVFIPATNTIDTQLRDFKASSTHIAIVVDEYGGTAGLVTIEDVLEEIVGEIRDEYDVEEPEIEVGREPGRYWVAGRASLHELSDALGHDFEREDVTTVGGLVYEELGRVPRNGEQLVVDGFRVVVERVVKRKVERVYFERVEALSGRPTA
jgi:CBS domain containing-hemolysin-like protein